jgi:hypothetical protein
MWDFSLLSQCRRELHSPCDITQRTAVILYRHFGMIRRSRNVGIKITTLCRVTAQKSKDLLLIHSFSCLDFVTGEQTSKFVLFIHCLRICSMLTFLTCAEGTCKDTQSIFKTGKSWSRVIYSHRQGDKVRVKVADGAPIV